MFRRCPKSRRFVACVGNSQSPSQKSRDVGALSPWSFSSRNTKKRRNHGGSCTGVALALPANAWSCLKSECWRGGCLGRGLFVFHTGNHENHGNRENHGMKCWKQALLNAINSSILRNHENHRNHKNNEMKFLKTTLWPKQPPFSE